MENLREEWRPGAVPDDGWEKTKVDPNLFTEVLRDAVKAVEDAGITYVLIGGIASAALGRPRWTRDIDVFVKPVDADAVLEALEEAGFETQRTNPHWIFKARRQDVLIDVIFRVVGDIYLDDDIIERAVRGSFEGNKFWVVSPEDFLVVKAAVNSEENPHHWHDALGVIASCELDWDYLVHRARSAARKVLSLLVYAESNDLVVPTPAIRSLFEKIYGPPEEGSDAGS